MKKLLLKTFFVFSFLLSSAIAKAQWVTIPDANFVAWLNSHGYAGCMNGNLMDTTCSAIVTAPTIVLDNIVISDLTGVQYFDSLHILSFVNSGVTTLPGLPAGLISLWGNSNQLTTLPALPVTLLSLLCEFNQLTSLPNLPDSLQLLRCDNNMLTALPNLPVTLQQLMCGANQLTSLPNLPATLPLIYCDHNQLTSLPTLPSSLNSLSCQYNQLTSLPAFPDSLQWVECNNNLLTSLPSFPDSLISIKCQNNQLTSLPELPPTLIELICSSNQLTNLPDLPDSVYNLDFSFNSGIQCFPKYKIITVLYWYGTGITCLPNAGIIYSANPTINNLPLCQPASGCNYSWNIYGRVYKETNGNCVRDSNEFVFRNFAVQLDSGGTLLQEFLTNNEGYYSFQTGLGNYEIKIDTTGLPFDVLCPSSGIQYSSLTAIDSLDENVDFGLQCKPGYLDLEAKSISFTGPLRPSAQRTLYLRAGGTAWFYGVNCATGVSGSVEAILSNLVSYVSPAGSALTPTFINGDTLTWNISDFSTVNPLTAFNIIVHVDTNATIGDTACFQLNIYPFADSNPANNSLTHCFPIVNSVDPNTKEIYPGGLVDTTQHDFTFTIYFQNTGTASADNIYILDTLDNDLDAATFQYLSSSHDPVTQLLPGNILRFSFPHINLADSTTNEQQSHGYVQFKVKRKNIYYSGMSITNRASIYFDFNPAVATNEAIAWFDNNLGITEALQVAFTVYPNPARDIINIETYSQSNTLLQIELFDITGRKLQTIFNQKSPTGDAKFSFSVKHLTKGVYVLKVNNSARRIIVE